MRAYHCFNILDRFPNSKPVPAKTMNYSSVVAGGMTIIAG